MTVLSLPMIRNSRTVGGSITAATNATSSSTYSRKVYMRIVFLFIAFVIVLLQLMVANVIYLHPNEQDSQMEPYFSFYPLSRSDENNNNNDPRISINQHHHHQQQQERRRADIVISNRNRGQRSTTIATAATATTTTVTNSNNIIGTTLDANNKNNVADQSQIRNDIDASKAVEIYHMDMDDPILRPIFKEKKMYSVCRGDRSGSVIADMIYAHAFAYEHNITYAGNCCVTRGLPKLDTKHLIHTLHWHTIIPFACPDGVDNKIYNLRRPNATSIHPLLLNAEIYRLTGEQSNFKPAWRQSIQQALYRYTDHSTKRPYHIAVHVRRGDVSPCTYKRRYLPNSHYLALIDQYTPDATTLNGRRVQVTIYSESDTFEPFDVFIERNYRLEIDTADLSHVWKALSTADVAILSRSYFSIVPAAINPNTVVATEFFEFDMQLMDGWDQADPALVKKSDEIIRQMFRNQCNGTKLFVGSKNNKNHNVNVQVATD